MCHAGQPNSTLLTGQASCRLFSERHSSGESGEPGGRCARLRDRSSVPPPPSRPPPGTKDPAAPCLMPKAQSRRAGATRARRFDTVCAAVVHSGRPLERDAGSRPDPFLESRHLGHPVLRCGERGQGARALVWWPDRYLRGRVRGPCGLGQQTSRVWRSHLEDTYAAGPHRSAFGFSVARRRRWAGRVRAGRVAGFRDGDRARRGPHQRGLAGWIRARDQRPARVAGSREGPRSLAALRG
jgi:hypothetical protein